MMQSLLLTHIGDTLDELCLLYNKLLPVTTIRTVQAAEVRRASSAAPSLLECSLLITLSVTGAGTSGADHPTAVQGEDPHEPIQAQTAHQNHGF